MSMSREELLSILKNVKCIVHIDLDCFYCQVEQVRLGLSGENPLAVQQWQGLIAVNYAARRAGIQRHCTVDEARKQCPEIQFVHVATYADGDSEPKYHENPTPKNHKVSLEPYRRASARIFKIFQRFVKNLERASIDEAYLDLTDLIINRIVSNPPVNNPPRVNWNDCHGALYVAPQETPSTNVSSQDKAEIQTEVEVTWDEYTLYIGSLITKEIRDTIFNELGYTCSAGITGNKTLSKLTSSLNKPNKQTIMRPNQVMGFMKNLPFQKIRFLGGKLGDEVESALGVSTAGDIWKYSLQELQAKFGDQTGTWLYNISRGIDHSNVVTRNLTKSMMAAKSLRPPVTKLEQLHHWLGILCAELYTRLQDDFDINSRWPKTLNLTIKPNRPGAADKTKTTAFPHRSAVKSQETIRQRSIQLLQQCGKPEDLLPCGRIALQCGGFAKEDNDGGVMSKWMKSAPESTSDDMNGVNERRGIDQTSPANKAIGTQPKPTGAWTLLERAKTELKGTDGSSLPDSTNDGGNPKRNLTEAKSGGAWDMLEQEKNSRKPDTNPAPNGLDTRKTKDGHLTQPKPSGAWDMLEAAKQKAIKEPPNLTAVNGSTLSVHHVHNNSKEGHLTKPKPSGAWEMLAEAKATSLEQLHTPGVNAASKPENITQPKAGGAWEMLERERKAKEKRTKSGILKFFNQNGPSTEASHRCKDCDKLIPLDEWMEHEDWHLAVRLSREDDLPSVASSGSSTVGLSKQDTVSKSLDVPSTHSLDPSTSSRPYQMTPSSSSSSSSPSSVHFQICSKCQKKLRVSEFQEHQDWHYALSLSTNSPTLLPSTTPDTSIISSTSSTNFTTDAPTSPVFKPPSELSNNSLTTPVVQSRSVDKIKVSESNTKTPTPQKSTSFFANLIAQESASKLLNESKSNIDTSSNVSVKRVVDKIQVEEGTDGLMETKRKKVRFEESETGIYN